jgi:hypothetical protein
MLLGLPASGYSSPTLLAHWTFGEGSGTIAHNSGPFHYHGTLSATGASFVSGGISGEAISLDATDGGLVNMGLVLNDLAGAPYTIIAWVKTRIVEESNQTVVATHKSTMHAGYFLGINTSPADNTANLERPGFIRAIQALLPRIPASQSLMANGTNW